MRSEAPTVGVLWKVLLKILQNLPENTLTRVPFLMKLQSSAYNFIKKEIWQRFFLWILWNF